MIQETEGDITAMAPINFNDFMYVLQSPSKERVWNMMLRGERAMWRQISQVDTRCLVEFALDDCIQQVRANMIHQGHKDPVGESSGLWYSRVDSTVGAGGLQNVPEEQKYAERNSSADLPTNTKRDRDLDADSGVNSPSGASQSLSRMSLVDLVASVEGLETDNPTSVTPPLSSSDLSVTMANYRRLKSSRNASHSNLVTPQNTSNAKRSRKQSVPDTSVLTLEGGKPLRNSASLTHIFQEHDGFHHMYPRRSSVASTRTNTPTKKKPFEDPEEVPEEEEAETQTRRMFVPSRSTGYPPPTDNFRPRKSSN